MNEIRITVPLEPPSVNHYKKHRVLPGGILSTFVTGKGKAYYKAVAMFSRGQQMRAKAYQVSFCVFQGKGSRGDADNYSKCVLDGLVKAGVIHSDAAITDLRIAKRRDWDNPRTEIIVRPAGAQAALFDEVITDEF